MKYLKIFVPSTNGVGVLLRKQRAREPTKFRSPCQPVRLQVVRSRCRSMCLRRLIDGIVWDSPCEMKSMTEAKILPNAVGVSPPETNNTFSDAAKQHDSVALHS